MNHRLLVTALDCEAKALIRHFGLFRSKTPPLRSQKVWQGNDMTLVVTGMGKVSSAISTTTLLSVLPQNTISINIGIAGAEQPLGSLHNALKITDAGTNKSWFPINAYKSTGLARLPGIAVKTLDQPSSDYQEHTAFDMEASGFFQAASLYCTAELIHCFKIISDNSTQPLGAMADGISKDAYISNSKNSFSAWVENLIAEQLPSLESVIDHATQNAALLPRDNKAEQLANELAEQTRFTESQRHQLAKLLHRYNVLFGDAKILCLKDTDLNAKGILQLVENKLCNKLPRY